MKKKFALPRVILLAAISIAALPLSASAFEKGEDYAVVEEIAPDSYAAFGEAYPGSVKKGWPACKTGALLKGTVITSIDGKGNHCKDGRNASYAFDGDPDTFFDDLGRQSYAALILDQAYELTEVRIHPCTSMPDDTMFGLRLQGSNDGVHWVDIILFNQDSHGREYHIFTPQTVTDPDYTDAGYNAKKDESIFWRGTGAYSMYRYINQSGMYDTMVAEIELYGNPAEATHVDSQTISAARPTLSSYVHHINVRNVHTTSENGALTGTVVGAGGVWNKNFYEYAFDGSERTVYDPAVKGPECWTGLLLDEPAVITEVRVLPGRGDRLPRTEGAHIQGSNDGIRWTTLVSFTRADCVETQEWITKAVDDPTPYRWIRYVNSGAQHGDAAELQFFGKTAEGTQSEPTETQNTVPAPTETANDEPEPPMTQGPDLPQRETDVAESIPAEGVPAEPDLPETAPPETDSAEDILSPNGQKLLLSLVLTGLAVLVTAAGLLLSRRKSDSEEK